MRKIKRIWWLSSQKAFFFFLTFCDFFLTWLLNSTDARQAAYRLFQRHSPDEWIWKSRLNVLPDDQRYRLSGSSHPHTRIGPHHVTLVRWNADPHQPDLCKHFTTQKWVYFIHTVIRYNYVLLNKGEIIWIEIQSNLCHSTVLKEPKNMSI